MDVQLLTTADLASRLRLQPQTIQRWTRLGYLPAIRMTGKVIRYDLQEVLEALKARHINAPASACTASP